MRVTPARRRGSSYVGSDKYDALLVISGDQPVMGKKGEIFDFGLRSCFRSTFHTETVL